MSDTQHYIFKIKLPVWYIGFTACFIALTFIVGSFAVKGEKPYYNLMYTIPMLSMVILLFFNLVFTTYRITPEQFTIKPGLAKPINIPMGDIIEIEVKQLSGKRPVKLLLRYQSIKRIGFYLLTPRQPLELLKTIRKFNPEVRIIQ